MIQTLCRRLPALLLSAVLLPALADDTPSPAETRAAIRQMRSDTLKTLYALAPQARTQVRGSAGYAVLSSTGVHVLLVGGGGGGRGVVHDNPTGRDTWMRSASVGVGVGLGLGLGLGVRDMSVVLVFRKRDTLKRFVEQGWQIDGEASATARAGDSGADVTELEARHGILAYPIGGDGLMAKSTVEGTKYWVDPDL